VVEKKRIRKEDDDVVISIKDDGIDHEIMPRLFSKFVLTPASQSTGLGLFIAKSIVEAYGSRMWAENNPYGKGANFIFSLPIR